MIIKWRITIFRGQTFVFVRFDATGAINLHTTFDTDIMNNEKSTYKYCLIDIYIYQRHDKIEFKIHACAIRI